MSWVFHLDPGVLGHVPLSPLSVRSTTTNELNRGCRCFDISSTIVLGLECQITSKTLPPPASTLGMFAKHHLPATTVFGNLPPTCPIFQRESLFAFCIRSSSSQSSLIFCAKTKTQVGVALGLEKRLGWRPTGMLLSSTLCHEGFFYHTPPTGKQRGTVREIEVDKIT